MPSLGNTREPPLLGKYSRREARRDHSVCTVFSAGPAANGLKPFDDAGAAFARPAPRLAVRPQHAAALAATSLHHGRSAASAALPAMPVAGYPVGLGTLHGRLLSISGSSGQRKGPEVLPPALGQRSRFARSGWRRWVSRVGRGLRALGLGLKRNANSHRRSDAGTRAVVDRERFHQSCTLFLPASLDCAAFPTTNPIPRSKSNADAWIFPQNWGFPPQPVRL